MELLIVIAILGVLASVVLGAVTDAREQGDRAKIVSEMDSLSKRAAINFSTLGIYSVVCGSDGVTQSDDVAEAITSIEDFSDETLVCNSSPDSYATSIPLFGEHWCVDSAGFKGVVADALTTSPPELECS